VDAEEKLPMMPAQWSGELLAGHGDGWWQSGLADLAQAPSLTERLCCLLALAWPPGLLDVKEEMVFK